MVEEKGRGSHLLTGGGLFFSPPLFLSAVAFITASLFLGLTSADAAVVAVDAVAVAGAKILFPHSKLQLAMSTLK